MIIILLISLCLPLIGYAQLKDVELLNTEFKNKYQNREGLTCESGAVTGCEISDALVKIGLPVVEPLISILKSKSSSCGIRAQAVYVLGEIGDTRAVMPLLIVASKDPWEGVRNEAKSSLVVMGTPAIESLKIALKGKDWRIRWEAAKVLKEKGVKNVRLSIVDELLGSFIDWFNEPLPANADRIERKGHAWNRVFVVVIPIVILIVLLGKLWEKFFD